MNNPGNKIQGKSRRPMVRTQPTLAAALAAVLLAQAPAPLFSRDAAAPGEEEQRLIALLESDAAVFEKAKACQRLAVIGTEKAVPALAALLENEELAHYGRFGLEPIPHPSAGDALRRAMERLDGKLLVGVINSIGVRRDAKALDGLRQRLAGEDPDVAAAAAAAMGRIGTSEAAETLRQALASSRGRLRVAVAGSCLPCAESLIARGERGEAIALYQTVRRTELPGNIQRAALRGEILARQADGVPLLLEQLAKGDEASFDLGLFLARQLPGSEVTRGLVARLGELTPSRRARVIGALGDRGDAAALPAVLEAARKGPPNVRLAAIRALKRLGDGSAVPVLLAAAAPADGETARVGRATLAELEGEGVNRVIAATLARDRGKLRPVLIPVLIDLVGQRRITSAVPSLREASRDKNPEIRLAAIKALGHTVTLDELSLLTARLADPGTPRETAAAQAALRAACHRMPDRDACAGKLLESMAGASIDSRCLVLAVFDSVGGARALEAAAASARDSDERVRDAATRVLGEWRNEEAASVLLELARSAENDEDRSRALGGLSHLVGRLGFPREERIAFCRQAMELARRDEERKLVFQALAAIPAVETLALLEQYLAEPTLKEGASLAAVTIAARLVRSRRGAVARSMKRVLGATENKELVRQARKLLRQAERKP